MRTGQGYLRCPTISGDTVVFCCDDDLWRVGTEGGRAWRLTAGVAEAGRPRLSPDGSRVAFVGRDEGRPEIHVLAPASGDARRLTYDGASCEPTGWLDNDTVVYASEAALPFGRDRRLYRIDANGGTPVRLPVGQAGTISYRRGETAGMAGTTDGVARSNGSGAPSDSAPAGGAAGAPGRPAVLGRNTADPAHWKRYRGGTTGRLWIDPTGDGHFTPLLDGLAGNVTAPCWVAGRIYFLSDHEGIGNVYSVRPDGEDLRRHTDHGEYYARHLDSDGSRMVYQCAADLYLLDPSAEHPRKLDVSIEATGSQLARRYVDAGTYLQSARMSPDGTRLAITTRGKAFSFGSWEGPVVQHGEPEGTRYRLLTWLPDGKRLVAAAAGTKPTEELVQLTADGSKPPRTYDHKDLGGIEELVVSPMALPDRTLVALTNHRHELILVELDDSEGAPGGPGRPATVSPILDTSPVAPIGDLAFSPDGRWLAYRFPETLGDPDSLPRSSIKLLDIETGRSTPVADRVLRDVQPVFDPAGRYLYFLGDREFTPVYDPLHFDLSFPRGSRPYAVALRSDVPSPFALEPKPPGEDRNDTKDKPANATDASARSEPEQGSRADPPVPAEPVRVDLDGLRRRVVPFPVPEARYRRLLALPGKVLLLSVPADGSLPWLDQLTGADGTLECYDFASQKTEKIAEKVSDAWLSADSTTLLYRSGDRLRVLKAGVPAPDGDQAGSSAPGGGAAGRESGWVDLQRVKVSVRPAFEWPQMFREAWNAQRQHFWSEDMSGVDWDTVYDRYAPLVARVSTRGELSDLLWEMQGELGTSHAYESGGDYRTGPHYPQGYLGVDYAWDGLADTYRLARIVDGDPADPSASSPLERPGVNVAAGDEIVAINGLPVGRAASPAERLVNLGGQEIALTVRRGDEAPRIVRVTALLDERPARYREWVETNRRHVHEKSEGRLGYLHIPNMMPPGYAEFLRGYLAEYDREGLVVDVRFNGGGHVSGLVLEKLTRRRLGQDYTRWGTPQPYPVESPRGPMVALTNAQAGSDGDIVCQGFKMLGLGPLVGRRTWGGVVGFTRMQQLADGSTTTQPGLAFSFDDVSWGVENHGVDPDVDVDCAPQDYAAGRDPQLDTAIEVGLAELERRPSYAHTPAERPHLPLPVLPPRPAAR